VGQLLNAGIPGAPRVVTLARIWNAAPHNAFTDLVRFRSRWYCAFREAANHVGSLGKIRIIASADSRAWESAALVAERGVDLRDPKLSVAPRGGLVLLAGGSTYKRGSFLGRQPRVARSADGAAWSPLQPILAEGDWLWRIAWHEGRAYGVTYRLPSRRRWTVTLVASDDGLGYGEVCELAVPGRPNETTVRFLPGGRALALVRREGGDRRGWIGRSNPPYTRWSWARTAERLGGPNFLVHPAGAMWGASRIIRGGEARTALAAMSAREFTPVLELPSGGDCGYPGMAWHRGRLWMSYYSSHEGKASIYLAEIGIGVAMPSAPNYNRRATAARRT